VSVAGQVTALAISQDNSMLAYAFVRSKLTKIRVIRTKSPATILNEISFNKPIKPIKKLSFSPNGKTLADDQGRQWNVADRRPQAIENLRNGITGYAISPDGSQAAMIRDKAIDLVSASDQKALKTVKVKLDRPFDVTFSPNGKWLAILGEGDEISEGQVRERVVQVCLYEIAHDRAKVWSVGGNKAQSPSFVSIAFDDSSQLLAFGIEKAPINVYQVDQRNEPRLKLLTRLNVKGLTQKIEIFNGGKNLIAGSNDGSVTVWDLKANKEIRRIGPFGHGTKDGYSFAASPDKEWFLRAAPIDPNQSPINAPQSSLQMWSLKNVQESRREARHVGIIRNLVFSPDGQSLLTSSPDGTVRLWDTKSGSETATLDRKGYENLQNIPIGFNSEGHVLVAERQVVEVCSADSLKVESTIGEFRSSVLGIALAPKGDKLAMVGLDQLPELWDTKDKGKHTALVGQKVGLKGGQCVAFSQDGKHLAVGTWPNQSLFQDREGLISIWDVEKGTLRDSLGGHPQRTRLGVFALSFTPDSRRIVYSEDDTLYLCDIVTGVQIQRFRGHTDTICSMALSPDGRLLASGSLDNTLRLWEVRTGKEIRRFEGHRLPVYSLAFSPDGRRLASGSADTTAIVWNVSAPIKLDRLMIGDICPGDTVELRSLWIELAGSEPDRAYQAQTALVRGAEISVPFLAQRLIKVKAPSQEEIDHLLTDLASEFPWIWDEARIKLIALGEVVEGPVRAALDKKPSPDLKEHLQDVLDALKDPANHLPSPDELRQLRAVAVLEHIGGAEAKAILKELATGYAKALVTRDAAESLERLAKRP
ncbi:MAG TPA: WD40 repeat domain-containing protein, partial [Gemmataceae bacterium]|nr:WD40 repeat domain-containing protein [Gemmataceae bacterium]